MSCNKPTFWDYLEGLYVTLFTTKSRRVDIQKRLEACDRISADVAQSICNLCNDHCITESSAIHLINACYRGYIDTYDMHDIYVDIPEAFYNAPPERTDISWEDLVENLKLRKT